MILQELTSGLQRIKGKNHSLLIRSFENINQIRCNGQMIKLPFRWVLQKKSNELINSICYKPIHVTKKSCHESINSRNAYPWQSMAVPTILSVIQINIASDSWINLGNNDWLMVLVMVGNLIRCPPREIPTCQSADIRSQTTLWLILWRFRVSPL